MPIKNDLIRIIMDKKIIKIIGLICALQPSISTSNGVAQLLLVREAQINLSCDVAMFPGKLYKVPSVFKLEDIGSSIGLELLTNTQELPFEDNISNASSIPEGVYEGFIRSDESKTWMKGNINRTWRIQLNGVPNRSAIQFHYGKDKSWSKGCIILTGEMSNTLMCEAKNSSEKAVENVRKYVESEMNSSDDVIRVKIIYE